MIQVKCLTAPDPVALTKKINEALDQGFTALSVDFHQYEDGKKFAFLVSRIVSKAPPES